MTERLKQFMTDLVDLYANSYGKQREKVIKYEKSFLCWSTIEFANVVFHGVSLEEAYDTVKQVYEEMEKSNGQ